MDLVLNFEGSEIGIGFSRTISAVTVQSNVPWPYKCFEHLTIVDFCRRDGTCRDKLSIGINLGVVLVAVVTDPHSSLSNEPQHP